MSEWFLPMTDAISLTGFFTALLVCANLAVSVWLWQKLQQTAKRVYWLENELRAMTSGQLGMGRQLQKFVKNLANVESAQQEQSEYHQSVNEKVYEQAGLLLARGATIEEVVAACEIPPAEAELLAIIQHAAPRYNPVTKDSTGKNSSHQPGNKTQRVA